MANIDEEDWPPREEATVQNENTISIDYVKVYAPILLVLAERVNAPNIIEILNKVREGTQTEVDLSTIQQWLGQPETENAFATLTPQEINEILSTRIAENNEIVKPSTDPIALSGVQGYCVLGQKRTRDCITVNNHQYSAKLFEQYYNAKKAEPLDGPIIDPYRTEISPELQKYLDNFFARINETEIRTRTQTKKLRQNGSRGGKKSRKSRKQKTRKTRKSNRKTARKPRERRS